MVGFALFSFLLVKNIAIFLPKEAINVGGFDPEVFDDELLLLATKQKNEESVHHIL